MIETNPQRLPWIGPLIVTGYSFVMIVMRHEQKFELGMVNPKFVRLLIGQWGIGIQLIIVFCLFRGQFRVVCLCN